MTSAGLELWKAGGHFGLPGPLGDQFARRVPGGGFRHRSKRSRHNPPHRSLPATTYWHEDAETWFEWIRPAVILNRAIEHNGSVDDRDGAPVFYRADVDVLLDQTPLTGRVSVTSLAPRLPAFVPSQPHPGVHR